MQALKSFKKEVIELNEKSFENLAIRIFQYQAKNNLVYQKYIKHINKKCNEITSLKNIPFLPIEFFKKHSIQTNNWVIEKEFLSSGTTGITRSKHLVEDLSFYHQISSLIFENKYFNINKSVFLALLPSYIEQGNSSLVEMLKHFIHNSESKYSGFYLDDYSKLIETVAFLSSKKIPVILFGVTYALLDLAENYDLDFSNVTVIETGGMKGRRDELSKEEVHRILSSGLKVKEIHSEYGMTELLSQSYSTNSGVFTPPNSMRILIRDINDPFTFLNKSKPGGINIIDLANVHSCSFIETKDIGILLNENKFKVLGRFDNSDIRGCNLLVN